MTIYQDLVGLCQDIKWRYAYAEDEGPAMWDKECDRSFENVRKRCRDLQNRQLFKAFGGRPASADARVRELHSP
jgi:hypothetical protein